MSGSRRTPRVVAFSLFALIIVLGVIWGPEIYYSIRYRQFESVTLPNGDGTVRFVVHWSENRTASVMHTDGGNWTGALGTPPLTLKVEGSQNIYWLVFPGTKSALRAGDLAWVETVGRAPTEGEWQAIIAERRLDYPNLEWDEMAKRWQVWADEMSISEPPMVTPAIPPGGASSSGGASGE